MVIKMAVENGGTDAGLLALLNQGNRNNNNDGMLGGGGVLTGLLFGGLLNGGGLGGNNGNRALLASDVQNIVNDSASAQTANSNALLLLKDIQDSSQGTDALIASTSTASQLATLNAEIANLQGQSGILSAIGDSTANLTAQHGITNAAIAANGAAAALASEKAAAAAALSIAEAKYQTLQAIVADGALTRNSIADLKASLPNAREIDLERQLGVAQANERHRDLTGRIDQGNVTVTTNVNQAQAQAQQQLQLQNLTNSVACLATHQQAMATAINVGGFQNATQTPTNIRQ